MTGALPYMIQVSQLTITVVGGGTVAHKRCKALIHAGANVHVVAPRLVGEWDELLQEDGFHWEQRSLTGQESLLSDWVFLCTTDRALHRSLMNNRAPRQMMYACDDAQAGQFYVPAQIDKGLLSVSVSTAGASPSYTKQIKAALEEVLPENAERDLIFLQQARKKLLAQDGRRVEKLAVLKELARPERLRDPNREEWFNNAFASLEKRR